MIDDTAKMRGPFWRPLRSDWAFWAFCLALVVDLVVRLPLTWTSSDGSMATLAFRVAVGAPFEILSVLVLFALVIGVPRGFLLGLRGGRRVGGSASARGAASPVS